MKRLDFQEPYLRTVFGFIGLTDVTFIHAEKQMRPEADASFAAVIAQISRIAREQAHTVPAAATNQRISSTRTV